MYIPDRDINPFVLDVEPSLEWNSGEWVWLLEVSGEILAVCTSNTQAEHLYRNYRDYVDAWVVCVRTNQERGTFAESRYRPRFTYTPSEPNA